LRDFADDVYPEYVEGHLEEEKQEACNLICCPKFWGNRRGYEEEEYDDLHLAYPDPWFEMGWPWGFWG
jgi:hypothetical protein